MALALGLVFRVPDFTCPSSHRVLLSSLCSPLHLPLTQTLCSFPGLSGFLAKCGGPGVARHRCIFTSPSGFYLTLPGSESREVCVNCQMRSIGMVLHAVGLCLSGALEQRSQSLSQSVPTFWHFLTKLTFHSRSQNNSGAHYQHLSPQKKLVNTDSRNAT